jgi:uncharacterized protein (TIGR03435 family)
MGTSWALLSAVILVASASTAAFVHQQVPIIPGPQFDVASVKPANPDVLQHRAFGCGFLPSGRFEGLGDLGWFIACAYGIPAARSRQDIVGLPKWADEELFEIRATFAPVSLSPVQRMSMVQSLLAERFKLVMHRERKEVRGYALVVARNDGRLGPHLQPTPKACADWIGGGRQGEQPMVFDDLPCGRGEMRANIMRQSRAPLSQLANMLSPRVERPVEDRTGLTGMYAYDLRWAGPVPAGPLSDGPPSATSDNLATSIFTAVREQLGLKLEPIKTIAGFLVIDHIERPTPN